MREAVPYLRVSTDDKDQNPERQRNVIEPWADTEGVALLEPVVDEGTSASNTNPFERPAFLRACEQAQEEGAQAVVVETGDRFCRQGSKIEGWAEIELELRYGLELWRVDKPLKEHGTVLGEATDAIKAAFSKEWVQRHRQAVKSGMAEAKKNGTHVGRPRKELSDEEMALARRLKEEGEGYRRIAHRISEDRGAFEVANPKRRKQIAVSHMTVYRAMRNGT